MPALDLAAVTRCCGAEATQARVRAAVLDLRRLAPWWLTPEAVAVAPTDQPGVTACLGPDSLPRLPDALGSCWIVCAVRGDFPLLRPAVVLPLRWRKGEPYSPHLPQKLRALADAVAKQIDGVKDSPTAGGAWGLHPAFDYGTTLADDLFETFDSGWAALAGGLVAAALGLTPRTDVWASAAWDGRPTAVEGLPAKMETAAAFGAKVFFVHDSQAAETPPADLRVAAIGPRVASGVTESLGDYFAELTDEPPKPVAGAADEDGQFKRCQEYFLKLKGFAQRSTDFYQSHLLDAIVRRYRRRFEAQVKGVRVRRFVTVVSFSPELAEIVVRAIQPERVLLLHTRDTNPDERQEKLALKYQSRLGDVALDAGGAVECVLGPFDLATAPAEIAAHVARFTAGVPEEEVFLDLKPGNKKMTYSVIAAARPANHLLNMEPEFRDDRRNTPGTEIPELLPAIPRHPSPPSA